MGRRDEGDGSSGGCGDPGDSRHCPPGPQPATSPTPSIHTACGHHPTSGHLGHNCAVHAPASPSLLRIHTSANPTHSTRHLSSLMHLYHSVQVRRGFRHPTNAVFVLHIGVTLDLLCLALLLPTHRMFQEGLSGETKSSGNPGPPTKTLQAGDMLLAWSPCFGFPVCTRPPHRGPVENGAWFHKEE